MVPALVPTIVFKPANGERRLGGTRIGGVPDLPSTLQWPRPKRPENAGEIAERGGEDTGKELLAHFDSGLPYTFFAQIDLAEAAKLGGAAADLPSDGRLQVYYDMMRGPFDTSVDAGRVVWDQSPVDQLVAQNVPPDLMKAHEERLKFDFESAKEYQLDPPGADAGTPYLGSSREMSLGMTYRLPSEYSVEMSLHPALEKLLEQTSGDAELDLRDRYNEMLYEHFDPYYNPVNPLHRMQLLGSPLPEQDDPRYDAVVVTEFGKQHLTSEEWTEHRDVITKKAREWRLLFQLDYSEFERQPAEGTIYFLIRDADLRERRFDRVIPVYQQT